MSLCTQLCDEKKVQDNCGEKFSYSLFLFFPPNLQVNIDIEDINDSVPSFESSTVRISVPENFELGMPLYAVTASDRDSGKSGTVTYHLSNGPSILTSNTNLVSSNSVSSIASNIFTIDSRTGHLTLSQNLDFETSQRHTLIVTAIDQGEPPLSSNLTIFVEVQDVNDNRYAKIS
jgi:protocadherin-16/23